MMNKGFTLLEITIALLIFSVVVAGVTESLVSGTNLVRSVEDQYEGREQGQRVIDDLAGDLRMADHDYIWQGISGDTASWSFEMATDIALTADGTTQIGDPIYGETNLVFFDRGTGELTMRIDMGEGTYVSRMLAADLTAFHVFPEDSAEMDGNRMTLRLVTAPYRSETPLSHSELYGVYKYLSGNANLSDLPENVQVFLSKHLYEREVYLRSKRFTTKPVTDTTDEVVDEKPVEEIPPEEIPTKDPPTEEPPAEDPVIIYDTPANIHDSNGPSLNWSENQDKPPGEVEIRIDASTTAGYAVTADTIKVSLTGEDVAGLSVNVSADGVISIVGKADGAVGVTVEAVATKKNKADETTRETVWF